MADYQTTTLRLNNAGILLRDDAELLKEGNYLVLHNLRSTFEGSITGRAGHALKVEIPNAGVIHTIRRIDQDHLFIGSGKRGYSNNTLMSTKVRILGGSTLTVGAFDSAVAVADDGTLVTIRPAGQGADNNWTLGGTGAATKAQALADDSSASWVEPQPNPGPETYTFEALSIDLSAKITKLRLYTSCTAGADDLPAHVFDRIGLKARLPRGADGIVSESPIFGGEGVFPTTQVIEWEVDRPGGGTWSVADINNAEFGFSEHNWSGHNTPAHYSLALEVTYTAPDPPDTSFPWEPFSGNHLTTVPFTPLVGNRQWLYIGDTEVMLKTAGVPIDGTGSSRPLLLKWGIEAPKGAFPSPPVVLTNTAGGLDSSAIGAVVYDWRYTYYSSFTGAESNPNAEMASGVSVVNNAVRLTASVSMDPQVDKIRFYRRGGTLGDNWRLVGAGDNNNDNAMPNATVSFDDGVSDEDLFAARFLDQDNFIPFPSQNQEGDAIYGVPMPSIWGPFAGSYIMGTGDVHRPGHVYWTNPNRPDSADVQNHVFVTPATEPLVQGFVYNGANYVWSQDNLYNLNYNGPGGNPTFVPQKTSVGRGTVSSQSFAVGPLIWFVHGSGIYETDGTTPPTSITELSIRPIFENRAAGPLLPIDFGNPNGIKLTYRGNELHFHYINTGGGRTHLIYDLVYKRWLLDETQGFQEALFYTDENTAQDTILIGTNVGTVLTGYSTDLDYSILGTSFPIFCRMRTGAIDLGSTNSLKEIGALLLDWGIDPANLGTATLKTLSINTVEDYNIPGGPVKQPTQTLSLTNGVIRDKTPILMGYSTSTVPTGTYLNNLAVDVSWQGPYAVENPRLFSLEVLFRPDKEQLVYWSSAETSHGISGWQMLRDLYLATQSNFPLTLTIWVDGIPYEYGIPPSAGNPDSGAYASREKNHIWLEPLKGKIFRYEIKIAPGFQSTVPRRFRIYGEDCEIRVKSWNSQLGYQLVSPFDKGLGG